MAARHLLTFAIAAASTAAVHAAPGEPDCGFGADGRIHLDLGAGDAAYDAVLQGDGRLVLVGSGGGAVRLTRLLPHGALDPDFGDGGTVAQVFPGLSFAGQVAIDGSGRIVVAGTMAVDGDSQAFVARFTGSGQPDSGFGGGDGWTTFDLSAGTASAGIDNVTGLAVDASDRPVIGGYADANGLTFSPSNANIAVARLTAAGELDASFSGDGLASASSPGSVDDDSRALLIDAMGRIVVTGSTGTPGTARNTIVARFSSDGSADTGFGGDGVVLLDLTEDGTDDYGVDVAVAAGGKLLVLGSAQVAGAGSDPALARLTDAGALDTGFAGDGIVKRSFLGTQDSTEHVLVQDDGRILVTGWPASGGFGFKFASMRFNADGSTDASWGDSGTSVVPIGSSDRAYAAVLQPDQKLLLAGGYNNDVQLAVARLLNDGQVGPQPTITTITGTAPAPSFDGDAVTVSFSVAVEGGQAADGTVTVSDGDASCDAPATDGSCSLQLSGGGLHQLTASYAGGSCSTASSSAPLAHSVEWKVTASAGSGGGISPSGVLGAEPGEVLAFTLTPDTGFRLAGASGCSGTLDGLAYRTAAITGNCSISVQFEAITYTLSYTAGAGGSIVGDAEQQVAHGGSGSPVSADPDAGFAFDGWSDGATGNPRTDTGVTADLAVSADFVKVWTVTPLAGSGGTLSPTGPVQVRDGDTASFTAVAADGYHLVSVAGCGGTLTGSVFETAPVTADCSISATFNGDPMAQAAGLAVTEDQPATGLLTATDDDATLTFALGSAPLKGTLVIDDAATGAYTYTPAADANGADSFTFTVSDGAVTSAPATVAVDIAAVNDPPALTLAALAAHAAGSTGARSVPGFASLDPGPDDEDATQASLAFSVDAVDDPDGVLSPGTLAIATDGSLAYTLSGVGGTATISVHGQDDGGTANGGSDVSAVADFELVVAPGADLQVAKDNGQSGLLDGAPTVYAIVAANAGPNDVVGATLTDLLPPTLADAAWSCVQEASTATCPAASAGTGDLVLDVDLPSGTHLRFDVSAVVDGSVGAFVTNTAAVAVPAGMTELDSSSDSATDSDPVVTIGLFLDGFEAPPAPLTVPAADAARRP